MYQTNILAFLISVSIFSFTAHSQEEPQRVEGYEEIVFHNGDVLSKANIRDYYGMSQGYMTAGWWVPGHVNQNYVSWKTAAVPQKKNTVFSFVAATSVLPAEISLGPQAKLSINGKHAVTFTIGVTRDFVWKEGEYTLRYKSERVEYPYTGYHRLFELHGNSGLFELSVPASDIDAGKAATLQVEMLPFPRWQNGWFMIKDHKDVLSTNLKNIEDQITVLYKDLERINLKTQLLATQIYNKMLGGDRFEHHVIYANGYSHAHPADLIKLKNGDLLMSFREGAEHISTDGDVFMLRSKDGGKTWGEKQVVANLDGLDEREACGIELEDGTIIWAVFFNNLYGDDGVYKPASGKRSTKHSPYGASAYTIRSTDGGKTWSKPNFLDLNGMPFSSLEGPTDAPLILPDGSIAMAVIGYGLNGEKGNAGSVLLRSTDKGQSWQYQGTIASDPGGKLKSFLEPGICRTKTGRLVALMRNHGADQVMYSTYSDDNGKTWAPVTKTELVGHPADIIQLSDGRLMTTYGVRPGIHTPPGGIRVCFSNDNGVTWDISTEIQLRNDALNWDMGYPESIQLPNGKVLTVYYYNLFGKYFLGATTWQP